MSLLSSSVLASFTVSTLIRSQAGQKEDKVILPGCRKTKKFTSQKWDDAKATASARAAFRLAAALVVRHEFVRPVADGTPVRVEQFCRAPARLRV